MRAMFSIARARFSRAWWRLSEKGWAARLTLNTAESPWSYMGSNPGPICPTTAITGTPARLARPHTPETTLPRRL